MVNEQAQKNLAKIRIRLINKITGRGLNVETRTKMMVMFDAILDAVDLELDKPELQTQLFIAKDKCNELVLKVIMLMNFIDDIKCIEKTELFVLDEIEKLQKRRQEIRVQKEALITRAVAVEKEFGLHPMKRFW